MYGVEILDTPSDGNCQFSAIAQQLQLQLNQHYSAFQVRKAIVDFLRKNKIILGVDGLVDLSQFVDDWDVYLNQMEQEGEWGDHITLFAAPAVFQTTITLLSDSLANVITIQPPPGTQSLANLLLGHVSELHYVGLINIQPAPLVEEGNLCADCGLLSFDNELHDCLDESLIVSMGKPHPVVPEDSFLCCFCGKIGIHDCDLGSQSDTSKCDISSLDDATLAFIFALATIFSDEVTKNIALVCKSWHEIVTDKTFQHIQYREWSKVAVNWKTKSEGFIKQFKSEKIPEEFTLCKICNKEFMNPGGLRRGTDGILLFYSHDKYCSTACSLKAAEKE